MPWVSFFTINSTSGEIILAQPINELRRQYKAAAPLLLGVRAREIASSGAPPMDTTAEVALVLVNTENHPKFASTRYVGTIEEGSPALTAVRWDGATICRVTDDDQGKNGTFRLYLEGDGGTFDVQPSSGMNQVDFAILVKNPAALDYESNDRKYLDFHVVAREIQAVSPLSSTTEATDKDTGEFWKSSVSRQSMDLLPKNLILNSETGVITLQTLEEMDREQFQSIP
ncbi:cadherin-86C-like [Tachypleus tridentatus]|uniref:cadherin-86C-like n=1 Tax=Tachypleus tridentatus TaxID=6853 RepID=UPI003FD578DD